MFEKLIERAVGKYLDRLVVSPDKKIYPSGYNPLPEIKEAMLEWLYVPFNGANILIKVRYPNYTQLESGGYNYGQIMLDINAGKELSDADKKYILNAQEYAAKCVMCAPTYEEFEKMIYKEDNALVMKKAKIAELKKAVDNPALNMFQRAEFQAELNTLDYFVGILLPSDTMDALTRIALGQDVTDIKKVTKDILTQAAVKSELYKKAPHEFISGVFTDRDATEIDAHCWNIMDAMKKEHGARRTTKPAVDGAE
jgi:hypothetical protein